MSHKVILFYPPYEGQPLGAPLCLLALAATLRQNGFEPVIIDAAVVPQYKKAISETLADALCLGISVLTGPMIRGAIEVAKLAKSLHPNLPVVFGGWHPTLLPDQTLAEPYIDVVVRGQGEITFCKVVEAFAGGLSLKNITGISWKTGVMRTHNPDRPVVPLDDLPLPAFDLVDYDAYERAEGMRKLAYATSIGCPYACNYCTDTVFYKRRFNALSAERVVREMTELVRRYKIEEIALLDSNFPVDLRRAIAIAKGIVDSGIKFRWTFQASTDFICRMTEDEIRLLSASGVMHMGFGTESASETVLKLMNKRHQHIDEMYETARRAAIGNIKVTFNLIFGYPEETEVDRQITFKTMSDIGRRFSNARFSPNIFTPYPGIPIWPQLRQMGVSEPRSLKEWGDLALGVNMLPWLRDVNLIRFNRMLHYFLIDRHADRSSHGATRIQRAFRKILVKPVRWRIDHGNYSFPWEIWINALSEHLVRRRSLIDGRELPTEAVNVC
ncbi:B12-binding domain-containing radical SAM protein [Edaphobacter albus]|uniref:B12-binding domain-containing radical SAM protein n=1 Tax=Edaphobacter sp. 4G125 TaxID=2763071 RepID=UPI001644C6D6|nr:radical SAM protein [Edaphobacter sp. 4G125]QNI37655.1 B12-binding domain-containing radical SAM protein [Edaphobacter sp. 4G125]